MRDLMKVVIRPRFLYAAGITNEITPARKASKYGVAWARSGGGWAFSVWRFWAVKLPRTDAMSKAMELEATVRKLTKTQNELFEHMN